MDQMLICVKGDGASNTCHSDEDAALECQRYSNGPRSQRWYSTFRQRSHSTQGARDLCKDYAYGLLLDHLRCASSESVVKSATQLEVLGRRGHGRPRQRNMYSLHNVMKTEGLHRDQAADGNKWGSYSRQVDVP